MELEVGEFFLDGEEVVEVEHFVEGAGTVEVVHNAVGGVKCLGHVHDLSAKRSHTGATAHPYHFALRVENRMEVAIRAAHKHLVARFEREDVRRSDTRHHILESHLRLWLEWRSGNAHGEHKAVALGRIVSHRVGANGRFGVLALEGEESELFPSGQILAERSLVDVLIVVDVESRNLNLCVATGDEVHVFAFGQSHDKLLDERSHVVVRDNRTFIFFDVEHRFGHFDFEVVFHLHLATEAPVVGLFFAREVYGFGRQYFAATFGNAAFALSATTFTATSRRKEHAVRLKSGEQSASRVGIDVFFAAVDVDFHLSRWHKVVLSHKQHNHKEECNNQEEDCTQAYSKSIDF